MSVENNFHSAILVLGKKKCISLDKLSGAITPINSSRTGYNFSLCLNVPIEVLVSANYRQRLREEMNRRTSVNSRYSIRAFARDLAITHSSLLNVLKHDLDLSAENFSKAASKLQWNAEFVKKTLIELSRKRSQLAKKKIVENDNNEDQPILILTMPKNERLIKKIQIMLKKEEVKKKLNQMTYYYVFYVFPEKDNN